MFRYLLPFFIFLSNTVAGQTYTWDGSSSSNWGTAANWTPSGVPGAGSTVQFTDPSAPNPCVLDANRTISTLVVSTGTLSLNARVLTATTVTITGGTVGSGEISSQNFNNVSGTNFIGNMTLRKRNGGGNNNWAGGNTFATISIINEDDNRYIRLANTIGDNFTAAATFSNMDQSYISIGYNGNTTFSNHVYINNSSTGYIIFGENNGTSAIASGYALRTSTGYNSGSLTVNQLTQNGTAANGTFNVIGYNSSNTVMGGNISVISTGNVTISNCSYTATNVFTGDDLAVNNTNSFSTVSGSTTFTKINGGNNNNNWAGGNTYGNVTFINQDANRYLRLSNTTGDTFLGTATFSNTSTSYISIAYNGTTSFSNNVTINNSSTGYIIFGESAGTSTIASGYALLTTGYNSGSLTINRLTQNGTVANGTFNITSFSAQNTVMGGNFTAISTGNITLNSCSFTATNIFTGDDIALNNTNTLSTVSGTTTITKINGGNNNNNWAGGNTFGNVTIINQDNNRYLRLANSMADTFTGTATFTNSGTSYISIGYSGGNTTFARNVYINNSSTGYIIFGELNGTSAIASGYALLTSGYNSGSLTNNRLTQNGTAPNGTFNVTGFTGANTTLGGDITITSTGAINLNTCSFTASNTLTGIDVTLTNANNLSTVSGTTTITKTSSGSNLNNLWTGGNTFGNITIINQDGAQTIRLANTSGDTFNGTATFIRSANGLVEPVYSNTSYFNGNISTLGTTNTITFGNGGGTTMISGSGAQEFLGDPTVKPVVNRMTMNTSSGGTLTLQVPVDVNNSLTMNTGVIYTTATNILTLRDETTTSTLGNAASFVDGPMQHIVSSNSTLLNTLNFPVGNGSTWRPAVLQISHTTNTQYTYRTQVSNNSAHDLGWTIPASIDHVSYVRYWDINRYLTSTMVSSSSTDLRTSGVSQPVVTLYYGLDDGVTDPASLTICKNKPAALNFWFDIGGTGATAYTGSITSTSTPEAFDSFSRFTLGNRIGGTNPLPVELVEFNAREEDNKRVLLDWVTASEVNNDYFTIERSLNGMDWEAIGQIKGAGTTSTTNYYAAEDNNPYNGTSYYRIKQTDFDGKFSYSETERVTIRQSNKQIIVYPNPANQVISINGDPDEISELRVFNLLGQPMNSHIRKINRGPHTVELDLSQLPEGSFLIRTNSFSRIFYHYDSGQ